MQSITKEQGIILTGFTGILCGDFSDFHQDAERRVGRPIFSHEFADKELWDILKEYYYDDFLSIMPQGAGNNDQGN